MDEFIENLQAFDDFLQNIAATSSEEKAIINKIKDKWEELNLNNAF